MVQADRFGTSVAESLRTHSDFMRVKRRQAAEERAAKVGVKLIFPIFFFIMPAMMVVAAGPGILQMVQGACPAHAGGWRGLGESKSALKPKERRNNDDQSTKS